MPHRDVRSWRCLPRHTVLNRAYADVGVAFTDAAIAIDHHKSKHTRVTTLP